MLLNSKVGTDWEIAYITTLESYVTIVENRFTSRKSNVVFSYSYSMA